MTKIRDYTVSYKIATIKVLLLLLLFPRRRLFFEIKFRETRDGRLGRATSEISRRIRNSRATKERRNRRGGKGKKERKDANRGNISAWTLTPTRREEREREKETSDSRCRTYVIRPRSAVFSDIAARSRYVRFRLARGNYMHFIAVRCYSATRVTACPSVTLIFYLLPLFFPFSTFPSNIYVHTLYTFALRSTCTRSILNRVLNRS